MQADQAPHGAHVRANGIRQHYLHFPGTGRPLVIVPGIASPAAMWGFIGARLAPRHDTYVLDVRGRGLSEAGAHLDYGLDACAADLAGFIQALRLQDVAVVGHSMGARIAIRMARHHAGLAARLVLLDPPVSGPGRRRYPSPLETLITLIAAAQRGEVETLLRAPDAPRWPEVALRARAEWLHTCDPRAITDAHNGFHTDDIHADLPHLQGPVALIAAGRGNVISAEDEAELRQLAPAMLVRRLGTAGHQMQVEDTEGFLALLAQVFDELDQPR